MAATDLVDAWKRHVLECGLCRNAQQPHDVCPIGREFWRQPAPQPAPAVAQPVQYVEQTRAVSPQPARPAPIISFIGAEPAPVAPPVVDVAIARPVPANMPDARFIASIAQRVAAKALVQTTTGAALAVPMEKTSKAISFASAPGVILNMPERDIEVYSEMKTLISALAVLAEMLGKTIMVREETKRASRESKVDLDEEQTALIVRQIGSQFGVASEEGLYSAFSDVAARVLRIGDRMGSFMRVDDDTRKVIRNARTIAISMQSEIERAYGGRLSLDMDMRQLVRGLRLLAMDLQGEIERRIGT